VYGKDMIISESDLAAVICVGSAGDRKVQWIAKAAKKRRETTRHHLKKRRFSETDERRILFH